MSNRSGSDMSPLDWLLFVIVMTVLVVGTLKFAFG